jgi:enoyl-CoA hydratase/carnithine racemase
LSGQPVATIPRPVIAAIRGIAFGGGLELAMACDLRVAADSALLGQPEILLGVIPGGGGTQRLPRLIGPARAKEMIWSGRQVSAEEALAIGLIDRIAPDSALEATALDWAASLAAGPPVAMGLAKRAMAYGSSRERGLLAATSRPGPRQTDRPKHDARASASGADWRRQLRARCCR